MRTIIRSAAACALFTVAMMGATTAGAQIYPSKSVRLVVTFPPGGSSDTIARLVAPKLGERLGQPVIVDNRPGGGGSIGADMVAKSAPDGYTLVVGAAGGLALNVVIYPKLPYDPAKDFSPITLLVTSPFIVAVHPSNTQVTTLKELIANIKAKPGQPFASGGTGTGMHLAGELFKLMLAADMTHVPYKGNGPALIDLAGGTGANGLHRSGFDAAVREVGPYPYPRGRKREAQRARAGGALRGRSGTAGMGGARLVRRGGRSGHAAADRSKAEFGNHSDPAPAGHARANTRHRQRTRAHHARGIRDLHPRGNLPLGQGGEGLGTEV